jgi:hypothetical protein
MGTLPWKKWLRARVMSPGFRYLRWHAAHALSDMTGQQHRQRGAATRSDVLAALRELHVLSQQGVPQTHIVQVRRHEDERVRLRVHLAGGAS